MALLGTASGNLCGVVGNQGDSRAAALGPLPLPAAAFVATASGLPFGFSRRRFTQVVDTAVGAVGALGLSLVLAAG